MKAARSYRARRLGVVAEDATAAAQSSMVRTWDSLTDQEREVEARGMEVYAGMVDNLDYHIGRVLDFLRDIGEYDNTIVLFFSDNGANPWYSEEYPGNRGSEWFAQFDNSLEAIGHPGSAYSYGIGWADACAGPLDRFKMTVSEGGIRSPMLIAASCTASRPAGRSAKPTSTNSSNRSKHASKKTASSLTSTDAPRTSIRSSAR